VLLADPTGLSSTAGQITIISMLLAAIVVGLRVLWQRRDRR
jgi:hypothetical protein